MDIGTLASIIAAITGIFAAIIGFITLCYTIYHSKGNVRRRIEQKQKKINELEFLFSKKYGLNASMSQHYPTLKKKEKLENDINELEKEL